MPAHSKSSDSTSKVKPESESDPIRQDNTLAETESSNTKGGRKKNKTATTRQSLSPKPVDNAKDNVVEDRPVSPARPQSILDRLPPTFPPNNKKQVNLDLLQDDSSVQKISDESTPPSDAWIQNVPFGKSPPNAYTSVSNAGSPPFQPSFVGQGGFNMRSPPISPPQRHARPVSYGGGVPPLPPHSGSSTSPYRNPSSRYGSPPAPHLPQQHFYAAPNIDLGLVNDGFPGRNHDFSLVKFAPIPGASQDENKQTMVVASEGDLSVLSFNGERIDLIGGLVGLGADIIDAVWLTWDSGKDPFLEFRPLIALTLHGPGINEETTKDRPTSRMSDNQPIHGLTESQEYITRVEVYSLSKQCYMAELLRTPPVQSQPIFRGTVPQAPPPVGRLQVQASGNYLVIGSGQSGEVYTFGVKESETNVSFECLGKFWTTIQPKMQRRDSSHGRMSDADVSPADIDRGLNESEPPIVTLHGRWLAYCPAVGPSRPSICAVLGDSIFCSRPSTLIAGTAPSRPSINCEVESPDAETLLGKVARGVAQEVVKGTKWLSEKGMQTWNSYWKNPKSPTLPATHAFSSPVYSPQPTFGNILPTHADEVQITSAEPELVSIMDLKILHQMSGKKSGEDLPQLVTFQPPAGCSFLAFTPNGLNILTANRKGNVYYIWDLMQLRYSRSTIISPDTEPSRFHVRVRQIAKYERLSPSTIVDIAWEMPSGVRFAVLTQNKTVHIFDLPSSAFKWPPARTARKSRPTSAPVDNIPAGAQLEQPPPGGFLASAMNIANKTQPVLANLRGRAPSMGAGFAGLGASGFGLASATGVRGGKAVAAGLSKSLGAATDTVSNIRHGGQSRLHLKGAAISGRLSWHWRNQRPVLSLLDPYTLKNYYVRKTKPRDNRQRTTVTVFDARKAVAIPLPGNTEMKREFSNKHSTVPVEGQPAQILGFCFLKDTRDHRYNEFSHPLGHAEIDTSAPYQPFHSDHRVSLSVFSTGQTITENPIPTASTIGEPLVSSKLSKSDQWIFGTDIPVIRLKISSPQSEDDEENAYGSVIYRETTLAPNKGEHDVEQIVSTTRKRKNKNGIRNTDDNGMGLDQDGFFEDDCDVLDFATDRV